MVEKSLNAHKEILEIRQDAIGHMHRDVASSLHAIGLCMLHKGDYLEVRSHLERFA